MAVNVTQRDGKEQIDIEYDILSRDMEAQHLAKAVREHWNIENNLHWQPDATFQEVQCRVRKDHADANFSIRRRTALAMLKHETSAKVGIKNKRLTGGWDDTCLENVLFGQ